MTAEKFLDIVGQRKPDRGPGTLPEQLVPLELQTPADGDLVIGEFPAVALKLRMRFLKIGQRGIFGRTVLARNRAVLDQRFCGGIGPAHVDVAVDLFHL